MSDQYVQFYREANTSRAFSEYCSEVYGIDLTQDGFSDKSELDLMIRFGRVSNCDQVVDIGCGNGKIDRYISQQTGAVILGIDYSVEAIKHANRLVSSNLKFEVGDINDLSKIESCDVAILIDSIYFSSDYERTLCFLYDKLMSKGRIIVMYSEFIFEEDKRRHLTAQETKIGALIEIQKWTARSLDLTSSIFELMKRKRQASERYKAALESEGNEWLFSKIHDESIDPAMSYDDFEKFSNRFIYCIEKE